MSYILPSIVKDNVRGIDVSKWNGRIDWKRLYQEAGPGTESRICMVSIRCGEAAWGTPDDEWENNWKGAHDAGFQFIDAYHAFHPSADPLVQADLFAERLDKMGGVGQFDSISNDFEVFDIPRQQHAPADVHDRACRFADRVEANTKRVCKTYTGTYFWIDVGNPDDSSPLARRPLWLAAYPNAATQAAADAVKPPIVPRAWLTPGWMFWQCIGTDAGTLPGIPGKDVDRDVFRSSSMTELVGCFASAKL